MNRHEYRVQIIFALYQSLLLKKDLRLSFDDNFAGDDNEFLCKLKEDLILNYKNYIEDISPLLTKWAFERLSYIEQAILLEATSEIKLKLNEKAIVIDEAIILTKQYCDEESYKYINGVLDKICVN